MTAQSNRICTVCSLLCPVHGLDSSAGVSACSRRREWLQNWQALKTHTGKSHVSASADFDRVFAGLLQTAKNPLIWIDGADVATVRAAVKLASAWPATIHVSQCPGSQVLSNVMLCDGWFGTTLAEVAEHSQLVITLGSQWLSKMPLLAERYFQRTIDGHQWWSISDGELPLIQGQSVQPTIQLAWPRQNWNHQLSSVIQQVAGHVAVDPNSLAEAILQSSNTAIVWEKSEFPEPTDEMFVLLLHSLAKRINRRARCSLLAMEADVGLETARACLLWLTGCLGTAIPCQSGWRSPIHFQKYTFDDWQAEFDAIVLVRTTPSDSVLPQIRSQITLCELPQTASPAHHGTPIVVGTTGIDQDGHLLRGDHGMTCYAAGEPLQLDRSSHSARPIAADLLMRAANHSSNATIDRGGREC